MTEQYQCQSYSDDNHVVQDCTCGKCVESWEEELRAHSTFPSKFHTDYDLVVRLETVIQIVRQTLLTQSKAQEARVRSIKTRDGFGAFRHIEVYKDEVLEALTNPTIKSNPSE